MLQCGLRVLGVHASIVRRAGLMWIPVVRHVGFGDVTLEDWISSSLDVSCSLTRIHPLIDLELTCSPICP